MFLNPPPPRPRPGEVTLIDCPEPWWGPFVGPAVMLLCGSLILGVAWLSMREVAKDDAEDARQLAVFCAVYGDWAAKGALTPDQEIRRRLRCD